MLKQPSSKERETLRGCSKHCTVAALLPARLSSNKGSTECIRRARGPANRFVVKSSLGSLTTASSLKNFCNGVSPQDAVSSSLCSLRKWSLARRLPHLADHHYSEEEAAWGTSLRSIAWPRTEALLFVSSGMHPWPLSDGARDISAVRAFSTACSRQWAWGPATPLLSAATDAAASTPLISVRVANYRAAIYTSPNSRSAGAGCLATFVWRRVDAHFMSETIAM